MSAPSRFLTIYLPDGKEGWSLKQPVVGLYHAACHSPILEVQSTATKRRMILNLASPVSTDIRLSFGPSSRMPILSFILHTASHPEFLGVHFAILGPRQIPASISWCPYYI